MYSDFESRAQVVAMFNCLLRCDTTLGIGVTKETMVQIANCTLPSKTHLDLGEVIQRPEEYLVVDTLVVRKMATQISTKPCLGSFRLTKSRSISTAMADTP
jgi:hypothetical protein